MSWTSGPGMAAPSTGSAACSSAGRGPSTRKMSQRVSPPSSGFTRLRLHTPGFTRLRLHTPGFTRHFVPLGLAMKSGGGVLCIALLQLVVGMCLLGIYEGYKVCEPRSPLVDTSEQRHADFPRLFWRLTAASSWNRPDQSALQGPAGVTRKACQVTANTCRHTTSRMKSRWSKPMTRSPWRRFRTSVR